MRQSAIWILNTYIQDEDRPFQSYYNWLFDFSSGNKTQNAGIVRSEVSYTLTVL